MDDIGDRDAPQGSQSWARWYTGQLRLYRHNLEREANGFKKILLSIEKHSGWYVLGFASFADYCCAELNLDEADIAAIRNARCGASLGAYLAEKEFEEPTRFEQVRNLFRMMDYPERVDCFEWLAAEHEKEQRRRSQYE
jgi:hypothetical protein